MQSTYLVWTPVSIFWLPCMICSAQVRWILLVSTIGCGATSSLGSLGIQIAIEKRAIQAMLRDVPSALAEANSGVLVEGVRVGVSQSCIPSPNNSLCVSCISMTTLNRSIKEMNRMG
eukprot:1145335-Pelagomonas_calceolata.AAC.6